MLQNRRIDSLNRSWAGVSKEYYSKIWNTSAIVFLQITLKGLYEGIYFLHSFRILESSSPKETVAAQGKHQRPIGIGIEPPPLHQRADPDHMDQVDSEGALVHCADGLGSWPPNPAEKGKQPKALCHHKR